VLINCTECDRSFTRSDALAKHMRTVHETEALRPSDPVPKHHSSNPQNKAQRLRLTLKGLAPAANGSANGQATTAPDGSGTASGPLSAVKSNASNPNSPGLGPINGGGAPTAADIEYENNNVTYEYSRSGEWDRHFPPDVQFSQEELDMPPAQLYALLKAQVRWAGEDADELRGGVERLEKMRAWEWVRKQLLLENVIEGEFADGDKQGSIADSVRTRMERDVEWARKLDIPGKEQLWWRHANGAADGAASG
jgi:hypothetical protein